ncbi:hypothetical protein ACX80O_02405 [Arthrobacter sp. Hz1]
MSETTALGLIGVVLSALIAGFFGLRAAMATAKVNREENAVTFSGDLLKEVRDLRTDLAAVEKEVRTLRSDLDAVTELFKAAINFSEGVMLWALGGCHGPMPRVPITLRKYFDPSLIDEHERQQANPKA